ncbi:MAG: hypothetical protein Q9223_003441 [Gallowayella weberi]
MLLAMPTYATPVPPGPGAPRTRPRPPVRHPGEALPNPYKLPGTDTSIDFVNMATTLPPLSSADMNHLISLAEQQTRDHIKDYANELTAILGAQDYAWKSVVISLIPSPNPESSKHRFLTYRDCLHVLGASALKMKQEGYLRRTGRILVRDGEIGRVVIRETGRVVTGEISKL